MPRTSSYNRISAAEMYEQLERDGMLSNRTTELLKSQMQLEEKQDEERQAKRTQKLQAQAARATQRATKTKPAKIQLNIWIEQETYEELIELADAYDMTFRDEPSITKLLNSEEFRYVLTAALKVNEITRKQEQAG